MRRTGLWLALVLGAPAAAWSDGANNVSAEAVVYRAELVGVHDRALHRTLKAATRTMGDDSQRPLTRHHLEQLALQDAKRLRTLLHAEGYFGVVVTPVVDGAEPPFHVTLDVAMGERYLLREVRPTYEAMAGGVAPPVPVSKLKPGDPAVSAAIVAEEKRLVRWLQRRGFPFATAGDRRVVVDHDHAAVDLDYILRPGFRHTYGPVQVEGLTSVRPSYVLNSVPWKEGAPFDIQQLLDLENELILSGLFGSVRVTVESDDEAGGQDNGPVPVMVRVSERKHRTVRVGANWRTDVGLGGQVSWEHRNFRKGGERLKFQTTFSEVLLDAEATYRRPNFLRPSLWLLLEARVAEESPDAYRSLAAGGSVQVERRFNRLTRIQTSQRLVRGGVAYKYGNVDQLGDNELFGLLYFPVQLDWNTSNDLLDPSRGGRTILDLASYSDLVGGLDQWLRTFGEYRHYFTLLRAPRTILAGRLAGGSLVGAGVDGVPASERFYAGGGGSVRGYEFQSLGPLAPDGTPLGGNALLETSVEVRFWFTERFGAVAFLDGGTAFEDARFDSDEPLRWGTGPGLRVGTPVGPVRMDLAFPLNRRRELDNTVQFYVSIGQAF